MPIPVNNEATSSGCAPVSSACVIYTGPDIECVDICNGSNINSIFQAIGQYLCDSMTPGTLEIDEVTATISPDANYHVILTEDPLSTAHNRIYNIEFQFVPCKPCADGVDGQDGAPGPAGADGVDGVDGVDGADGAPGPKGADGVDGSDGIDGIDGVDGTNGTDGTNGSVVIYNSFDGSPTAYIEALSGTPTTELPTYLETNVDVPAIYLSDVGDSIDILTISDAMLSTNVPIEYEVQYSLQLEEVGGASIDIMDTHSSLWLEISSNNNNINMFIKKIHIKRVSATKILGFLEYSARQYTPVVAPPDTPVHTVEAYQDVVRQTVPFELIHDPTKVLRINYIGWLMSYDLHGQYLGMSISSSKKI